MSEKVLIFGHKNPDTDSICSALVHEILDKKNGWNDTKAVRLGNINKETKYVLDYLGIEAPELIEKVEEGQEVLLVDHNAFNQSADGIEKAKILGVTDHHMIKNFETSEPIYYTAKPYGCTCTILFEEFKILGHKIDKKEAVLMLSAIISDTLLLKSPTTTDYDRKALEELRKIAEIDVEKYGLEMLKAGTDLSEFTAEELINIDSKKLETNGLNFQVAQVNTVAIEDVLKNQKEIEEAIKKFISVKKAFINPAMLGLVIGLPLFICNVTLPKEIFTCVELLGKMTTPLCMIILGMRLATITLKEMFCSPFQYAIVGVKQIVMPMLGLLLIWFIPIDFYIRQSLFILAATPVASITLNFAEMLGKGQKTAANLVLLGTILSVVTLPLMALIMNVVPDIYALA